jgi:putative tryptophan/tyrosine transport system substrate-binding protein
LRRREFITLLGGGAVIWPLLARAQQPKPMRRIGAVMVNAENEPLGQEHLIAFRKSLADHGWVEGQNVRVEYRFGAANPERAQAYATELVGLSPDVILVQGTPGTSAFHRATRTIPIVFVTVADPVGAGFVDSLARPGGNVTGFSAFEPEIGGKWVELLKEISPGLRRVAGLVDPQFAAFAKLWRTTESLAQRIGLEVTSVDFHDATDDIESAVASFAAKPNGGLIVLPTAANNIGRHRIFSLAARHRLPAVYPFTHYTEEGGMMAYGLNIVRSFSQGVTYVDRILRGEKPADLPVQAPNKFELALNLKAARSIGLEVPPVLLGRADEVIE